MVKDTLTQLKEMLLPLRIYNTTDKTTVEAELSAYACGIDLVKEQLKKLCNEGFVQTANNFGLTLREKMLDIIPQQTEQIRRKDIIEKLSMVRGQWDLQKVQNKIEQTDFDGKVFEDFQNQRLIIKFSTPNNATLEELSKIFCTMKNIIPAHLEVRSNMPSISWDKFKEYGYSFVYLDKLALSFDSVESIS